MKTLIFKKTFPSKIELVRSILEEIMDYLSSCFPFLSSEDYYDCKLIYNELLINAIIHGNGSNSNKYVSVTIEVINQNSISSTITDEGSGFDYNSLLRDMKSANRLFLERGRGIRLVESLTNEIHYSLSGKQIKFYKRMKQNG